MPALSPSLQMEFRRTEILSLRRAPLTLTLMDKEKDKSNEQEGFKSEGLEEVLASLILEGWL